MRQCLPPLPQEIKRTPFIPSVWTLRGVSSTVVVTTNLDGKLTTLPESPTMDGYTFNGWYTEPVGRQPDHHRYRVHR